MNRKVSRKKLVVFDVEGVLLPKNRYLAFEVGRNLSFLQFFKILLFGLLYEIGALSLESALKKIFKLFQGFSIEELLKTFKKVPLLPYTETVFAELKKRGFKTALISSGLPQVVVADLASRLKADYAFGLELETGNKILTGIIKGDVLKKNGKALVMKEILDLENLSKKDCVVVADDRNNAPIFYPEILKIGYKPDFLITVKSDRVIEENLLELISILEGKQSQRSLSRHEAIREAIHVSGFFITFASMLFGIYPIAFLLFLTTLIFIASELARLEGKTILLISSITLKAATLSERYEFTATPIYLALGVILSLLLFPTPINYASIAIVCLGDSAASIFGKLFGKTTIPFNKGKSLEGFLAGFVFAFLSAAIFLHPLQAFVGAILGMFVESLPLPVNDNLSTPLAAGISLAFLL